MLIEDHEIAVKFDFLLDYNTRHTKIFDDDEFE
jgi:hypothetical protein